MQVDLNYYTAESRTYVPWVSLIPPSGTVRPRRAYNVTVESPGPVKKYELKITKDGQTETQTQLFAPTEAQDEHPGG
jgi:hypothetical protein